MDFARYVRLFFGVLGLAVALDAAAHLVFDPHQVFGIIDERRLGLHRPNDSRQAKAELVARAPWDVVVVGSSRVEAGIGRPADARLGRVFGLGLAQTNVCELKHVLAYVLERRPRQVVLFLEPDIFQKACFLPEGFQKSRFNPERRSADHLLEHLFGYDGLVEAFFMLRPKDASFTDEMGFFYKPPPERPRATAEKVLATTYRALRRFELEPEHFRSLRWIADLAAERGVRLTFAFSPVHATMLEVFERAGLTAPFERIKTEMARIVEGHPSTSAVWDFAGLNAVTEEAVPEAGAARGFEWFYEPSHFNKVLGARLLDVALGRVDAGELGVELTRVDRSSHFVALREALGRHAREHAAETAWLNGLLAGVDGRTRSDSR